MSAEPVSAVPQTNVVLDVDPLSLTQLINTSENPEAMKAATLGKLHEVLAHIDDVSTSTIELQPGNSVIQVFLGQCVVHSMLSVE
jgi:hypothetical protein